MKRNLKTLQYLDQYTGQGIKIKPIEFEFWKQGEFRIHSREQYLLKKNNWTVRFLSP